MDFHLSEIELAPGVADDGQALILAAAAGSLDADTEDEEVHAAGIAAAFRRCGQCGLPPAAEEIPDRCATDGVCALQAIHQGGREEVGC